MSFVTIKIRRSTTAQWASSTKILGAGELGLDTTLNKIKVGNGTSLWSALPFINVLPSEFTELAQDAVESALTAGTGITKVYNDSANTITLAVDSTIANKTYVDTAVSGLSNTASTTYIPLSLLGNFDGVAELDASGFVPDSQISATIARDSEVSSAISTEVTNRNSAISTAINNLINSAPGTLDTLGEIATALTADESAAAALTTLVNTKAPKADPTFTGTVSGVTKAHVGLGNVDNTTDVEKPISTATQTALDLKANLAGPTFTGTVSGITKTMVGLSNVDNTSDDTKALISYISVSAATRTINSSTDKNRMLECSNACTITIPNDTQDAGWPIGSMVEVRQVGTGQITITKDAAVTMVGADSGFKSRVQWSTLMLEKRAANSWIVTGDTTA
jgi:hypothetical protein